ncbi:MAG TPA: aldo/keto reductase [Candidatus Sulfotelmatobacter sp.]|nr:aldo/keto reductase [Candidatus Sulfotelmatobacter sp.]
MQMNQYTTLGRSGLRVSPLCLGTMTFGTEWGWGAEESVSRQLLDRYLEAGGNFIDTADGYTLGKSEEMLGKFIAERKLRDRIVLATKFSFSANPANPNAGGNGRKNIHRALEGSLRRLQTDYIDLYWLHAWDTVTPVEEVVNSLNDLVRQGKILHYGFSDTPAWYLARAYTLAETAAKVPLIALQLEYSLVQRNIEREHIPAAQELGLAVCPWSPLASGFLTGKYRREGSGGAGDGRLEKVKDSGNPTLKKFSDRNWQVLDVLLDVARQIGRPPAQVALNWVATQPGITSTILGASKLNQLEDNLKAIEFTIPAELRKRLDEIGAPPSIHPYEFFEPFIQTMIHGSSPVKAWQPARTKTELASSKEIPGVAVEA